MGVLAEEWTKPTVNGYPTGVMLLWIVIGAAVVLGYVWLSRASELFYVSVRDGKALLVRGRIPQGLLNEFEDVVQRAQIRRGVIRALRGEAGGQLYASGDIDDFVEQRLRNIFRIYPVSQLRAAPRVRQPTLGQLLGIAWLAWMFDRS